MTGQWKAGFEIEVILGDLDDPRFIDELSWSGAMDMASPAFCRAVAKLLQEHTARKWTAPKSAPSKPGFYVIAEYGLDPLIWPAGRLAGVELLTPPLPLDEAEAVRQEIIAAVMYIDGDFNFIGSEITRDCGWHINIDCGDEERLDPHKFVLGVDELGLLARNDRLFTAYTGLQRHSVGVALLRHLQADPEGVHLHGAGLINLIIDTAGRSKSYAANFAKLERNYLELRHFSAESFFTGPSVTQQLGNIPEALDLWPNQTGELEKIYRAKFLALSQWLDGVRHHVTWQIERSWTMSSGKVMFAGEVIGTFVANGHLELYLHGPKERFIASIRGILLPDICEAVALLALDLAELHNLGSGRRTSASKEFQQAVLRLSRQLKADKTLSSAHQSSCIEEARQLRDREFQQMEKNRNALGG